MEDKRVDEIFEFIENANIDLDPDPISRGPKYLNTMVAECRNLTNEVQKYEREVAKARMAAERNLNRLSTEYEMRYNDLMTNDPKVISLPSAKDRDARVNDTLKDLKLEMHTTQLLLTDMGHVHTIVSSKLKELRSVNSDLRLQIRLVQDEIATGTFWGDETDSTRHHISHAEIDLDEMVPPEQVEMNEREPVVPEDDTDPFYGNKVLVESNDDFDFEAFLNE